MGATSARPGHGPSIASRSAPTLVGALTLTLAVLAACSGGPDRVAVYAEVVRHMTTEEGQSSGFPVIYVLERVVGNRTDPDDRSAGQPLPSADRRALVAALRAVAPVEFVATRSEVVGPQEGGARVRDGGIFLTLGPISGDDDRATVPASGYIANLAGSWQTWVVERVGERWRVTGTEGPVAVS